MPNIGYSGQKLNSAVNKGIMPNQPQGFIMGVKKVLAINASPIIIRKTLSKPPTFFIIKFPINFKLF